MEAPEPPQPRPALPPSLQELRSRVSETAFCDASDAQLVKFLYARKGDVDRAAALVQSHCEWKMMKWQMAPLDLPTAAEVLPLAQTGLFCVPGCRDKEGLTSTNPGFSIVASSPSTIQVISSFSSALDFWTLVVLKCSMWCDTCGTFSIKRWTTPSPASLVSVL